MVFKVIYKIPNINTRTHKHTHTHTKTQNCNINYLETSIDRSAYCFNNCPNANAKPLPAAAYVALSSLYLVGLNITIVDPGDHAVLRPLLCWYCGFESRWGYVSLSFMCVV